MTTTWSRVRLTGPLAPYAQRFAQQLLAKGYTDLSVADQLRLMTHMSRWMHGQGLAAAVLGPCWATSSSAPIARPDGIRATRPGSCRAGWHACRTFYAVKGCRRRR